ncbi:MAG TPA: hypothetical protein DDW55_12920 [Gammaproteobacteria bacterium]|nr:hypothetical protein [Gammaproteobacteria bacterium]
MPDPDSEMGMKILHPQRPARSDAGCPGEYRCRFDRSRYDVQEQPDTAFLRDGFLENYDVYADWISTADIMPLQTLLVVQRQPYSYQTFEH